MQQAGVEAEAEVLAIDASGYQLDADDLQFLGIYPAEVTECLRRVRPLGMTPADFNDFVQSLSTALEQDELYDADVRLKGSATTAFSSPWKRVPYTRLEITREFIALRLRTPVQYELDQIEKVLEAQWPEREGRPSQRPFDSMYKLRIDSFRSDYDVQLCSDVLVARIRSKLEVLGLDDDLDMYNPKYGFVDKRLLEGTCPALKAWELLRSDILGRQVSTVVFPSAGPANLSDSVEHEDMSAHLRETDWRLVPDGDG